MEPIVEVLNSVVAKLSDKNYAESVAFYRLWFDIGQTYLQVTSDHAFDSIWSARGSGSIYSPTGQLIHSTARLILRFAGDVDAEPPDRIPPPHNPSLQSRLSARSLQEFFSDNLTVVRWVSRGGGPDNNFYTNTNLIAHWANLGYVGESAIRNHILQSLISHPRLYEHQADALIILFKLAGATFAAYADPSLLDRCFDLLGNHWSSGYPKKGLVQELVVMRQRGWEGLPPPPVFDTGKSEPAGVDQKGPAAART